MFVKICGLANAEDVRGVAELRPDAMGFVFWKGSKRCAEPRDVGEWTAGLPPEILKVGVFVDASAREIQANVVTAGLDVVQLHAFQTLEKSGQKLPRFGKTGAKISKVWKVVHLMGSEAAAMEGGDVDAFLLDSYSAESPGGTGQVVDWARAREFVKRSAKPVVLAGGLKPENIEEALETVRPWGVDVSSGVEIRPGVKDLERVKDFINRCRAE
ncbi:MAG: phosphoribosylanthranilate isomerase [Kiritimatiellae bacterium]|nr:phosphoribosylanthranilate isomerase [Kiritimatiellia bacterium]